MHTRRFPTLLVAMLVSVAAVTVLALWDRTRESARALEALTADQTTLATAVATSLAIQLDDARHDALIAGDETSAGRPVAAALAREYLQLRVRPRATPATAPRGTHTVALTVPLPDGRAIDLLVPADRLLPGAAQLERARTLRILVLPPGHAELHAARGEVVPSPSIVRALRSRQTRVHLSEGEAARLGLPSRTAVAGLATVHAGDLGTWGVAVVRSAMHLRDREVHGRARLVLGVLLAAVLVSAFGGAALRTRRKELDLQRALAEADLRRRRDEQLERETRAATMITLTAGVAHEVSTPLAVIAGRAEQLAARPGTDERGRRHAQVIVEQADRIRAVLRGFLHVARGDTPALEAVAPADVVRGAVVLVEHRFAEAGVRLRAEVPGDVPPVRGDLRLLEHAIVNLLLNACDACASGGEVVVRARADGGVVHLEVADDGAGISPADAARVLEPFFTTKPVGKGTGLGLAVTNEIVKIHRGELALAPREPRGTTVTVRIPLATAAEQRSA